MIDTSILWQKVIDQAVSGRLLEHSSGNANEELLGILSVLGNEAERKITNEEKWTDIPDSWTWCRLSDLTTNASLNDGDWILKKDMVSDGEVKLIQLGCIGNCEYRDKGFKYLTKEHYEELNGKRIFPGYLLINRLVVDRMVSCIIPDIEGILITAVDVCWVAPNEDLYDLEYIMYALASSGVQQKVKALGHGVTRFRISKLNLIDIAFPLPPLDEQRQVVKQLKEVFGLLSEIDRLQELYKIDYIALKEKIIDVGIRGGLTEQQADDGNTEDLYMQIQEEKKEILKERKGRADKNLKPIDDEIPFDIPCHWKWIRFGETGLFKKGPFGSALTKSMFVPKEPGTVKVYEQQHAIKKSPDLGTYYITREYFDNKMSGFEVKPGDIIVSCAGTIGETYLMPEGIEEGIINQALMRITVVPSIDKQFFQYFFDSNLKKSAQSESNGMAITNIPPFDVLKNWFFPLVPIEEQKRIVQRIDELLAALSE